MYKYVLFIVMFFLPITSQAGLGINIYMNNDIEAPEGGYPYITAHIIGDSECWYDNALADWNQFAVVKKTKALYTERKNSGACHFKAARRSFALFIKQNATAPWKQLSPNMQLQVDGNSEISALLIDGEPVPENFHLNRDRYCGLDVTGTWRAHARQWKIKKVRFFLSGTLKQDCILP